MPSLPSQLPWATTPIIINAPMAGIAVGRLAASVTRSGGLGMIGSLFDMGALQAELTIATDLLRSHPNPDNTTLPVGVGLLPFVQKQEEVIPILQKFKPTVVWLFAAKEFDDYATWAAAVRAVSPKTKIWIQCGSVSSALYLAKSVKPNAICIQGSDAGGHGFEKGAGIISLLPEATDVLEREGFGDIPLIAAGGIVNGRGVAAALALGASGVVMGTAFLGAEEAVLHPRYREAVLKATDGGQSTIRSKLFDELSGPTMWPEVYDGRSLVMQSYRDFENEVPIEEIRRLHGEAKEKVDKGFDADGNGRAAIWVGAGVGMVNKIENAGQIVERVVRETREVLGRVARL